MQKKKEKKVKLLDNVQRLAGAFDLGVRVRVTVLFNALQGQPTKVQEDLALLGGHVLALVATTEGAGHDETHEEAKEVGGRLGQSAALFLEDEAEQETHERVRRQFHQTGTGLEQINHCGWRLLLMEVVRRGEEGAGEALDMGQLEPVDHDPLVKGRMTHGGWHRTRSGQNGAGRVETAVQQVFYLIRPAAELVQSVQQEKCLPFRLGGQSGSQFGFLFTRRRAKEITAPLAGQISAR